MREWWSKLAAVLRRDTLDRDLRAEIETHLQMEIEANVDRGMRHEDAVAAARRRFGNQTVIQESTREAWMFIWLESLVQDLRYGMRLLRRSPGFAFTAIVVIALGIGATTAAFTLLDHVLLRPLPFADPKQLVMLHETEPANGVWRTQTSPPNFLDWRAMSKSFDSMGAYFSVSMPLNLSGRGDPLRIDTFLVTSDVFTTLGVQPAAGRVFTADDDRVGGANVVLLTHHLALALFGSAGGAVGETVHLDNQAHIIVGVMPADFAFPRRNAQMWRPLRFSPPMLALRSNHILYVVARLRRGVLIEQARADMDVIAGHLQRAYPKDNARTSIAVVDMRDMMSPQSRMLVLAIFAAAFCLMLIACTNLASLLFARAIVRRHEMAIRIAIGAARARLLRQLLTEGLLLAVSGGAVGFAVAAIATPLLARLVPTALPVCATPNIDWRVFAFAAAVTLSANIAFGLGPALQSWRQADPQLLRSRSALGGRSQRLRATLVFAEVVGTMTLLVGAGLLAKALWRVQALDPGFRTEGVLTLRTALPVPKYSAPATRHDFYSRILSAARAQPGVISAAYVSYHPMEGASGRLPVVVPGVLDDRLSAPQAVIHFVTPGFFDTLDIPLLGGRDVDDRDHASAPFVTVISDSLAQRLWPGQDPIGRRLVVSGVERTVIGVAANIAVRTLEGASDPQIYFPAEQLGRMSAYYAPNDLMIHAADVATLGPAMRKIIQDVDPEQPVSDVRPLEDIVRSQTAPRRDQLMVLSTFAVTAFLLAVVGIHGFLSFMVSSRRQEIGVRVALGAARGNIMRMFLRQGLVLGTAGIVVALPLAYLAARGMSALLFGVQPSDPVIYISAALLAVIMTLAGSLRPAVRAAIIDPAATIRAE